MSILVLSVASGMGGIPAAYGQAYMTETGHAEFESSVPLHSFTGSSEYLVGKIDLSNKVVDFYLDLTTLDTGNDKRDKDMRETLETGKYPFAEFYGRLVSDVDSSASGPVDVQVRGRFSIHGVERQVRIGGTLHPTDEGLRLEAAWTLNLTDYEIKPPGILFYRVDEEIDIKINALLEPVNS